MSVTNTPVEQKQQQRHNYSSWHQSTSSVSASASSSQQTQNPNDQHNTSQPRFVNEPSHHIGGSNASISQGGSFSSGIDHDSGGGIIATSSPRGREQSEEAEERGRSRLREDQVDSTDDSFDDISLMGFKTGTKHHSPIKMKKVR